MIQVSYLAKTADEFKSICQWLKDEQFLRITKTSVEKSEDTFWEDKWKALSGEKRMRITGEEVAIMERDKITREDIAKLRCEKIEGQKKPDQVAVPDDTF